MNFRDLSSLLVLAAIGIISALTLTFTARYSYPIIEQNRQEVLQQSILKVLPGATSYKVLDKSNQIYTGWTADSTLAGYAFIGAGGGYQGVIKIMIGIDPDWKKLKAIQVIENLETPGLGAKITSEPFLAQFRGLAVEPRITYVQNKAPQKDSEIQAITGATISSRAVVRILNAAIARAGKYVENREAGL